MASLIERLRKVMGQPASLSATTIVVPLDDQSIERLMRLLCETRDDELSCEEVYGRLDEYVDCLLSRQDVGSIKPLLEHHLSICPDCRDELNALVHALENAAADNELN